MKPIHLTILLAVLSALLLPQCAHAQWSDCYSFACESYAYYDSSNGGVYGYSRTFDGGWWPFWLTVYSDLLEPGSEWPLSSDQAADYGEATAYVEGFPDNAGTVEVEGEHGYWLEDEEETDGESEYPVQVGMAPYILPLEGEWINDGDSGNFSVSVARGTPTSYLWGFDPPHGAGNSPEVSFTNSGGSSTGTDGHWYAFPLAGSPYPECSASPDSNYTIYASVWPSGEYAENSLTVSVPWIIAGRIWAPGLSVNPEFGQYENGEYYLLSSSWVDRGQATAQIAVPSSSQFYAKTYDHEQVHVAQFAPGGMFANTFSAAETYNRIMNANLSAPDTGTLMAQVEGIVHTYVAEQIQVVVANKAQSEAEAYAVSDPIDPGYLYQGYCPNHPDF